jgi:ankyrin repeat protein
MHSSRRLVLAAVSSLLVATCHVAPGTDIAAAAADGDVSAIERIIRSGRSPNVPDPNGLTPLIWAAREGRVEAVRVLIERGADPDLPDSRSTSWSPLMHAIHRHQPEVVAALLDGGAKPDRQSASGLSPLMMAAGYGQTETVTLLLQHGARPRLTDDRGENALDLALTGVSDIDDLSITRCQDTTTQAILAADPEIPFGETAADRFAAAAARVKHCLTPARTRL